MELGAIVLIFALMLAGFIVSQRLKSKFKKYSKVTISSRLTGKDVAERMLSESNISDVKVISVEGFLTDHYNPLNKTVNLSPEVYHGQTVAAAAVAAHECGHAVQHATAYSWLQMRSALVPMISLSSRYITWILLIGILTLEMFPWLLLTGIVLFALTTLFSFVTLPVEFDASRRALVWLNTTRITSSQEHTMAKDALWWAAMTYVVAALSSLATLLYYIMIYMKRR